MTPPGTFGKSREALSLAHREGCTGWPAHCGPRQAGLWPVPFTVPACRPRVQPLPGGRLLQAPGAHTSEGLSRVRPARWAPRGSLLATRRHRVRTRGQQCWPGPPPYTVCPSSRFAHEHATAGLRGVPARPPLQRPLFCAAAPPEQEAGALPCDEVRCKERGQLGFVHCGPRSQQPC